MKITKVTYRPSVDNNKLIRINIEVGSYDKSNYRGYAFCLDENLENVKSYQGYIIVDIFYRPQLHPKLNEMIEQAKLMVKEYMNELYGN